MDAQVLVIPPHIIFVVCPYFHIFQYGDLEYKISDKFGHMLPHMRRKIHSFRTDRFKNTSLYVGTSI